MNLAHIPFDVIVTIVAKGYSEKVLKSSKAAGAEGGTIIPARGAGIHDVGKIFGIPIEPEKEIVLTILPRVRTDTVVKAIYDALQMDKPGNGICFVMDLSRVAGLCHTPELDG